MLLSVMGYGKQQVLQSAVLPMLPDQ